MFAPLLSLLMAVTNPSQSWNLNDVSYLLPLDQALEDRELIPTAVYQRLPSMDGSRIGSEPYSQLKAVGIRIDPEASEVRMVWQEVHPGLSASFTASLTTEDSGLHSFYHLTQDQMRRLLAGLHQLKQEMIQKDIRADTFQLELQVHPAFQVPAIAAEFREKLRHLILEACNADNLFQMTVMQVNPAFEDTWWVFTGIAKNEKGEWVPMTIARLTDPSGMNRPQIEQKLFHMGHGFDETGKYPVQMKLSVIPNVEKELNLNQIDTHTHATSERDLPQFKFAMRALNAFENPHRFNAKTLDCVECHLTEGTRFFINQEFPEIKSDEQAMSLLYQNPNPNLYHLKNKTVSTKSTKILRAFGYYGSEPAVNQRVIHESAEVAEWINLHYR